MCLAKRNTSDLPRASLLIRCLGRVCAHGRVKGRVDLARQDQDQARERNTKREEEEEEFCEGEGRQEGGERTCGRRAFICGGQPAVRFGDEAAIGGSFQRNASWKDRFIAHRCRLDFFATFDAPRSQVFRFATSDQVR